MAWQGWSAIASAGGSLLGSLIGAFSAKHETKKTNEANLKASNEQNETQIAMNRENNQFAHDEADLAYKRELEKMRLEQQYNSPIEQLKRFQEAGVNPSVAFAGNMAQAVGGSSSSSAPMAQPHGSGVTPTMPTLRATDYSSFAAGVSDSFLKSAEIFKTFAEAKKQATENKYLDKQIQSQIDALQASTEGQKLANMITQMFGKEKATAELALFAQQAITLTQQGKTEEAKRVLMKSEEYLNYQLGDYHGENKKYLEQRNKTYLTEFAATLENIFANTAAARAHEQESLSHARLYSSQELTEKENRKKAIEETFKVIEETTGIKLDNSQKEDLTPLIEKEIENVIRQQGADYWNPFRYVGTLLGGAAGAGIKAFVK